MPVDVVALAFDRHQRGLLDRRAIDQYVAMNELLVGQRVVLEHGLDGLQIELRRQIHDRQIFFVEVLVLLDAVAVALHQIVEQIDVRIHVAFEVHGHEAGQLHEARIHRAHEARMRERHGRDDVLLKPVERARSREIVDLGRVAPRIDRPAHQRQRGRLQRIVARRHDGGCRQHRHGRLANRHEVRVLADELRELDDVVDVIVEIETADGDRHVARVVPVGDVDIVLGQHGLNRAAQQRGVVARHRRDDQHLRVVAFAADGFIASEVNEIAERFDEHDLFVDRHGDAGDLRRLQAEFGFAIAPRDVFENFAGGDHIFAERGFADRVHRPLKRVTKRLHAEAPRRDQRVRQFVGVIIHRHSWPVPELWSPPPKAETSANAAVPKSIG